MDGAIHISTFAISHFVIWNLHFSTYKAFPSWANIKTPFDEQFTFGIYKDLGPARFVMLGDVNFHL